MANAVAQTLTPTSTPVTTYGQNYVDTQGNSDIAKYSSTTGAPLVPPTSSSSTLSNGISSTSNSVSTTPPTIPATDINGTTPVTLPTTAVTPTKSDTVGSNAPTPPTPTLDANGNPIVTDNASANTVLTDYMAKYATKGATANALDTQYGLPQLQSDQAQSQKDYLQAQANYEAAQNASNQQIANMYDVNSSGQFAGGNIAQVQRQNTQNLANLAVVANIAQANATGDATKMTAAQNIIQTKLSNEFQPISDMIGYLQNYIAANKNNLTASQTIDLQTAANNAVADHTALLTAKQDAYNTLMTYGIYSTANAQAVDAATTPGQVSAAILTAINPNAAASSSSTSPVSNYNLSSYSTDPTYTKQITATSTSLGDVSLPSTADSVIKAAAPTSQITGAMLTSTATANNIDPNVLASVLQVESNYGTKGAAVANNNPGNVKFTGQPDATKGSKATDGGYFAKFATVQDGLNAAAQTIAADKIPPVSSSTSSTNPYSSSGKTLSQFNSLKASAPLDIGQTLGYVKQTGDVYMPAPNPDPSTNPYYTMEMAYAKENNITVLPQGVTTSDVSSLANAMASVGQLATAWKAAAPNGALGNIVNSVFGGADELYNAPGGMFMRSGATLKNYQSLVTQANNAISAMTNSNTLRPYTGSLSAKSLPTLSTNIFSATSGDTKQEGIDKINNTITTLNNAWNQMFPNSSGAALQNTGTQPTKGQTQSYQGANYTFDGTQWVKQ